MGLRARTIADFSEIDAASWETLDHRDNPFLSHAFLLGLERTGSIGPQGGWHPRHLVIEDDEGLAAFAPTYAKDNSHGEFVFDWAWADAYQRNRMAYYPKLLTGVPYTPVTGPRLLVRRGHEDPAALKRALADYAVASCREEGFSTWHCNFLTEDDSAALDDTDFLRRRDWQFHWHNRGYADFDDFLSALKARKRKNIRRERERIRAAGFEFEWNSGRELDEQDLEFVYFCYIDTFRNYGNYPALKPAFFSYIAKELGPCFQVVFARHEGRNAAMAVFLAGGGRLYGRYWGTTAEFDGLHFETAYYQGIEFCIRNGIGVFESGAQGEHKIPRGFIPVRTRSLHHVEHPVFREAIARHLEQEKAWIDEYHEQLKAANPYRQETP